MSCVASIASRVDLPGVHLVGVHVDRRVGPDVGVAPDGLVGVGQAGHRPDHLLVGALEPVARRLVAQRRLEPDVAVADRDVVVLVVEQPHQARVRDRDVVALEVVVGDDLPVRRLRGRRLREALERLDPVRRELLREPAERGRERRGVRVEVDEDEAGEDLDAGRHEAELRLVEAREPAPLGHADQAAVGAVGPAVVRAADRLAAVAAALAQAGRAVAADVAEGAQLALLVADDQRGLGADLRGDEAARLGHVGDVPGELPGAREDRLLLAQRRLRVHVEAGVQRGALRVLDSGHLVS